MTVGQDILRESFALIERELGPLPLPPWAFAVVRRMIHASADFDFAHTLRYSPDIAEAVRAALRAGAPVVTDTEMVLLGIRTALAGLPSVCYLNDPETPSLATTTGLTRSAAGIRQAAKISSATSGAERAVRSSTLTPASLRIHVSWRRA